jgi:hypothetical protein
VSANHQFLTVPQELLPTVHACMNSLRGGGYAIKPEHLEDDYPETATLLAKQGSDQRFYVFDAFVKPKRVQQRLQLWAGYGRSCAKPTFIVHCIPQSKKIPGDLIAKLKALGVGLTMVDSDGMLIVVLAPIDLTLNLQLPPRDRHRPSVRRELQRVQNIFEGGDWKRGFEESCKLVEEVARNYLMQEVKASMVQIPGKGKGRPRTLTTEQVSKFTLGQLARVFCDKLTPKQIDSLLCSGLQKINPDRVNLAHRKLTLAKERKLRDNIGRLMWTIDNLLFKIPA